MAETGIPALKSGESKSTTDKTQRLAGFAIHLLMIYKASVRLTAA